MRSVATATQFRQLIHGTSPKFLFVKVLSMKQFEEFHPMEDMEASATGPNIASPKMVLDSVTLANLEIFVNSKGER